MEPRGNRKVGCFDPLVDAARRWPGWWIRQCKTMDCDEWFCPDRRTIYVKSLDHKMVAHAVGHLDLDHLWEAEDGFSEQQEADAEGIALLRLDCWPDWAQDGWSWP